MFHEDADTNKMITAKEFEASYYAVRNSKHVCTDN